VVYRFDDARLVVDDQQRVLPFHQASPHSPRQDCCRHFPRRTGIAAASSGTALRIGRNRCRYAGIRAEVQPPTACNEIDWFDYGIIRKVRKIPLILNWQFIIIWLYQCSVAPVFVALVSERDSLMAKAEIEMVRDIMDWQVSDDRKLGLIQEIVSGKAAPEAAAARAPRKVRKVRRGRKAAKRAEAPATAPVRKARRRRGAAAPSRRAVLWAELKRIAPERAQGIRYTQVSADKLAAVVDEVKKAQ